MDLLILKNDLAILVLFLSVLENQHLENTHKHTHMHTHTHGPIHPLNFQGKHWAVKGKDHYKMKKKKPHTD